MTNSTLISVVVPCYNQAQYMDDCLQSVHDQTYQNWECIIVNDGSPDNTEEIALSWTQKDQRFRYLKKENGGLSSARNAGINIAKGEWILPLDSDDKIGKDYLLLASKEFDSNYTLIYCEAELFGDENKPWNLAPYSYQTLLYRNHIFCSAFFKKSSWEAVEGGYDVALKYGREDWDFWLSILNPTSLVHRLPYVGFYYRRKIISMDTELAASEHKQLVAESYIYKKHLDKYLKYSRNPIKDYMIREDRDRKLELLIGQYNKNFLTRLLYKVLTKL